MPRGIFKNGINKGWFKKGHFFSKKNNEIDLLNSYEKQENGCWKAICYTNPNGYAFFSYQGKSRPLHRLMYEKYKGKIPEGSDLDHLCRNRFCVNPLHLEVVTRAENVRRGNSTKLNNKDVEKIKILYWINELTQQRIGQLFNIGQDQISRIIKFKVWI